MEQRIAELEAQVAALQQKANDIVQAFSEITAKSTGRCELLLGAVAALVASHPNKDAFKDALIRFVDAHLPEDSDQATRWQVHMAAALQTVLEADK